jgi:predicted Holliday junction resolvase-like endonuclease
MDILIVIIILLVFAIGFIIYCEKTYVKKDIYHNDVSVRAMREAELRAIINESSMFTKELVEAATQELKNREKVKLKNL